jgi:two-component system sensor histidine kinase UhpB
MPVDMARYGFLVRWLLPALAALLWLALATPAVPAQTPPQVLLEALAADDTGQGRFPADSTPRAVSLPDDWTRTRPLASSPLWYRLRFDVGDASDLLGLYFEHACANVEVQLNGQRLRATGPMIESASEPAWLDCQRPLLLPLPATLLQAGGNTLDLRLSGYTLRELASHQRAGVLAAPLIGDYAALAAREGRDWLLAVTLPMVASALLLLTALVALVVARSRGRDSHLLSFAGLAAGWALLTAGLWWQELPLSNFGGELLQACLLPLVTLSAVQFLLHYAGWRSRPIEVALYAQCVAVPGSLLLAGPLRVHMTATSWSVLLTLQVLTAMTFFLWTTWHTRRRDFFVMGALLGVAAVTVGLNLVRHQIGLPSPWHHLPQVLMPLTFVAMGLHLVRQQIKEPFGSTADRVALGDRAREASAAMEKTYAEMVELRVEQVTRQERKRIAGDLHDDLGAKLLTIVHTSDSERISSLAREALEEMRLSVRGLTGKSVRLTDALGDWRAEVVGRLSQTGVESEWSAPTEELPQTLSARAYVQTTRILREAVSNIIKHSGASRCSVRCAVSNGDFQLRIQDNGRGIPLELDGRLDRGHGMASMKHRAKQLQGQCLVESGPGYGTVIRLTLPLEQQAGQA